VHVVIMGCGRVGSDLARTLTQSGHSVAVIDQNAAAFERLGPDFPGTTVVGVGFDRGRLIEAGIEKADAFAAVSNGDNSNILAARVARETFNVASVVARIYDPGRAEIYTRLGIPTVATVRWTADQILRRIDPEHAKDDWRDPSGKVLVTEAALPPTWVGTTYAALERTTGSRVVSVNRYGEGMLIDATTVIQDDDIVHIATEASAVAKLRALIASGPEGA
jgi:trk system potassium uptake protein TrkA